MEEFYPLDLGGGDRQQLSQFQGASDVLAEDNACHLQQPWPGRCKTPVETRPPVFGLPRISEVNPLPWGTPVQGLGFPDGLVPDDGERLYSHPKKKKQNVRYTKNI